VVAQPGDTAETLAQREHAPVEDVVELNDVADARAPLAPGSKLFVPEGATPAPQVGRRFAWPIHGIVSSGFGSRPVIGGGGPPGSTRPHEGIDIAAPQGTEIHAAADGEVVYSGNGIRGYGNVVIVKHSDGFLTVYAHNLQNRVQKGERVVRGQLLGLVGQTGHATAPHLHFEVRYGETPRNPITYLEMP
jgi:murein DD-endopeptidase MepM/ murein hydrolase activator NlpD